MIWILKNGEMAQIEISEVFGCFIDCRRQSIAKLKEIAAEIQLHNRNKKISNITGATAGIVGSGLGIAGFGLTFVFPPVGLGLIIAGAALGGAGGATGGGATLLVHVLSKRLAQDAQRCFEEDIRQTKLIIEQTQELESKRSVFSNVKAAGQVVGGLGSGIYGVTRNALKLADAIGDVATIGKTYFAALSTGAKVFHVAGMAFTVATLPLDIFTIFSNARSFEEQHEMTSKILGWVEELENDLPAMNKVYDYLSEQSD